MIKEQAARLSLEQQLMRFGEVMIIAAHEIIAAAEVKCLIRCERCQG